MSNSAKSLDEFIARFAKRIAIRYPNSCSDKEDYIQAGQLKLAEINNDDNEKRDFQAYAITVIARAMRESALESMGSICAPKRVKILAHKVELLLASGKKEREICNELKISPITLVILKSLINVKSFDQLFNKPTYSPEPFSVVDDLLLSGYFTEEDRIFLRAQLDGNIGDLGLTRKQRWIRTKGLRSKVIRSGYGI